METAALIAPVTGLEFLQDQFLLTGEGPVLSVFSLQPRPKAGASLNVLQQNRIHGIRPAGPAAEQRPPNAVPGQREQGESCTTGPFFCDLAVFGGKAVRLVRLHAGLENEEPLRLEIQGPLLELQDWVLDARWLSGDQRRLLCVAVAHNAALLLDVVTGNVQLQHFCLEGCLLYSALLLVHESWNDTVIVGGTVFNQLIVWKPGGGDESGNSGHKAPVARRLPGHSGVIFSISYLQEKGHLASASDDRSVRVWGVGTLGGPGGRCGDVNPACLRVLYGHQARVFAVRLSPGRVFSAGEDGSCLMWDWDRGESKVIRTLKGHRAGGVRALAVSGGTGDKRWVATGGADGGVRLWKVKDSLEKNDSVEEEEEETEKLTDLKFPDQGLPKVVCITEENKNPTWSASVVCTDRGIVCQYRNGTWETLWQGSRDFHSYSVMDTVTVNVKDSPATVTLCAVGSISGSLQVFPTSHPQSGISLTGGSGKIHTLIWQKEKDAAYLLASGPEGLVYRWRLEVKLNESGSLILKVDSLAPFLLPRSAKRWLTAAVRLHRGSGEVLWVCGDRRGSLLLFQEEQNESLLTSRRLVNNEGKETGGKSRKMEKEESKEVHDLTLEPLSCLFGVHGKYGVTSVCEYRGLFYSTSKDGWVRIFRVRRMSPEKSEESSQNGSGGRVGDGETLKLEVLRVQRACKGMEWLERVLILKDETPGEEEEHVIEDCSQNKKQNLTEPLEVAGKEEVEVENGEGREARFVIVGFHAAHFVVWDPVRQERLFAVHCGGGHRSWSLWPSHTGTWPGYGALVFIKQGAVLTSRPPGESLGWTGKAERTGGWTLREGVHGRGIWCVRRLGRIEEPVHGIKPENIPENEPGGVGREGRYWEIVVTGGEDTSLAVLALHPVSGTIRTLSVITDHISGVRTLTAVTRPERGGGDPSRRVSALLVSAGGRAQIQAYRLLISWDRRVRAPSCQVIQVARHRLDEQWEKRRNRHKTVKMDPETRYMSVAVVEENVNGVLLALSCSDGALRLFTLSEAKNQVDLLWETFYHQRCVLSVAACSLEDDKSSRYTILFSAATDGKIAVWHLTEALSPSTDNSSGATTPPIPCLDFLAHQSGINSLVVWVEKLGREESSCLVTVASGGDDGQLTLSTIRVQFPEGGSPGGSRESTQMRDSETSVQTQIQLSKQLKLRLQSQSCIPLAHAAPLTALKLLSPGLLVSTSSDQRVCLWRVSSTGVGHSGALCSHVADAAGLEVWEGDGGDEHGETGLEPEPEHAVREGKESGGSGEDEEAAHESKDGEPAGPLGETLDPVCKSSDDKGGEITSQPLNKTQTHSSGEVNAEQLSQGSCESREKMRKGWVLVCGQGVQLLRLRNAEMDTDGRRNESEKENQRVTVTF
ncbi:WD repeat-containing protein 6 [Cololabis saira]|uniref:WD repeat-containing protein 6 n=1 Tax=Cololabis saira TaxID=129043 RepID=UPI002AD3D605|nr:WD repeat-containing protein 6 [Cololabis saira]